MTEDAEGHWVLRALPPGAVGCLVHGGMLLSAGIALVLVLPPFKRMFMDMGVDLPLPTKVALRLSDSLTQYWYVAALVLIVFLALDIALAVVLACKRHAALAWIWISLVFVGLLIAGLLIALSISLPLAKMNQALGGSGMGTEP